MAKTATAKSTSDGKKKKKKSAPDATVRIKVKAKKSQGDKAGKPDRKAKKSGGYDGLSKLVDHPLVADLLAAGALAAVAAIAEHKMGSGKGQSSSKMVKSVGKAAAAAMGRRLMGDIGAITTAATDAARKA